MIIRNRQKKVSLFRRVFGAAADRLPPKNLVLTEAQFQTELLKEIYRSDRRPVGREVGLVRMIFEDRQVFDGLGPASSLLTLLRNRLRLADSIGIYDSNLAFLLPETDKNGAMHVANELARIAIDQNFKVDTEVSVYPWDDELVALADELNSIRESDQDDRSGESSENGRSRSGDASLCDASARVSHTPHAFVKSTSTPWWKRMIDIVGSGIGLLVLSPVFFAAAIAIKLNSSGPVLFLQMREGKDGKSFGILKFRTMYFGAEKLQADLREQSEQDGPAFKLKNDPRVTTVGKYLRKSCVDELPQLLNVLLGQMSLVGPRPLPIHESNACTAWQRARLSVLPGLTCTWQVHGGREVKFSEWMRMDLEYIEKQSFWFDLKLIFQTAFIALLHRGSV